MEAAEAARRAAAKSFAEAVEASAENVVEVHRHEAEAFRQQVLRLARQLGEEVTAEELESARQAFRGELRQYREKAGERVRRLREELDGALAAMQSVAAGVSSGGEQHETVLRREFGQLEEAVDQGETAALRAAARHTIHRVTASFEELKRSQAMVVAQLRDEIRVLQTELQRGQQASVAASALLDKQTLDLRIEDALRQDRAFAVVLLGLPGLRQAKTRYPREVMDQTVAQIVASFEALVSRAVSPQSLVVGAWGEATYAAVVPEEAIPNHDWIPLWQQQLSVCQVFQQAGLPRTLRLEPRLALLARKQGESVIAFLGHLADQAGGLLQPRPE